MLMENEIGDNQTVIKEQALALGSANSRKEHGPKILKSPGFLQLPPDGGARVTQGLKRGKYGGKKTPIISITCPPANRFILYA